jgi:hypothetical protein
MKEIHALATSFSSRVFSDWTQLNAILKRFEAVIRKRWLKKSIKQRREVLFTARPNIPHVHRPDFVGFRDLGHLHVSRKVTCGGEVHLTPYINLEVLQQGHNLLLFIHSRGRHVPSVFASTDTVKAHLGYDWTMQPEDDGIAMLLTNSHDQTPRKYGALVPVSKLPYNIGSIHSFVLHSCSHPLLGCVKIWAGRTNTALVWMIVWKVLNMAGTWSVIPALQYTELSGSSIC